MQHVGFVAAVRHVDERDGLVEREYLFVGWIVRWHQLRLDDIKDFDHVLGLVVRIDRWQPHLLLQAEHPQGEFRLNFDSFFGVLEFVEL